MANVDFSLYLITDRKTLPPKRSLCSQVEAALKGGVRAVQLREKDLCAAELYPLASELRSLTREYHARLLINDRIDVALAVDADGVHLGAHSLPVAEARTLLGRERLIGVSTHSPDEISTAACAGADFVTFGPVYATPSKLPYGEPVGLESLKEACRRSPLPVFALGGVTLDHLPDILKVGCKRAACIGSIFHAENPSDVARRFLISLDRAEEGEKI